MAADAETYVLIVNPVDQSVFTCDGRILPAFPTSSLSDLFVNSKCRYVREHLDLPFEIVFLRGECDVVVERRLEHLLFLFEIPCKSVPDVWKHGKWVARENTHKLRISSGANIVREYLQRYSIDGLNVNAARLLSFSKPGWLDMASGWAVDILCKEGFVIESVEQFGVFGLSCLLLIKSQCGSSFFVKGCYPTGFYNEVAVSVVLGAEMPGDCMQPLGADMDRNLLLLNDYGLSLDDLEEKCHSLEDEEALEETKSRVITTWGNIQLKAIAKRNNLIKGGVTVWDRERYYIMIEEMFDDMDWWSFQEEQMSEQDRSKYDWEMCKDMFLALSADLCRRIGEYKVPLSLVHGDFHGGNVLIGKQSQTTFIDLSYTVWSFPFLDRESYEFGDSCDVEEYLELWTDYESMARLKELYELVEEFVHVFVTLKAYHMFRDAEQSLRTCLRDELGSIIERHFAGDSE